MRVFLGHAEACGTLDRAPRFGIGLACLFKGRLAPRKETRDYFARQRVGEAEGYEISCAFCFGVGEVTSRVRAAYEVAGMRFGGGPGRRGTNRVAETAEGAEALVRWGSHGSKSVLR